MQVQSYHEDLQKLQEGARRGQRDEKGEGPDLPLLALRMEEKAMSQKCHWCLAAGKGEKKKMSSPLELQERNTALPKP